jgi:ABC-type spermidine/putrescine transport system permease subunit II
MTVGLWIGVAIALLAGIIGVPLALGMFRKRDR